MPFKSTAQQRWAFGTGQPFAEQWAKETKSFKSLPTHVRAHSRGGAGALRGEARGTFGGGSVGRIDRASRKVLTKGK